MRALLVLHALCAFATAGAATHLSWVVLRRLFGRPLQVRLVRIYALTVSALLWSTVALGLLAYPAYKVRVVAPYFMSDARWAIALFDLKEALALFAVPLAAGIFVLGRRPDPDKPVHAALATFALALFAIVAFCVVAGLVITAEKGL